MEENLHFKIHWPSLTGQFSKYKPRGAYIWRGDLMEGFLHYQFGAHGWACFWNVTVFYFFIAHTLPSFLTASLLTPHACPHFSSTYSAVS